MILFFMLVNEIYISNFVIYVILIFVLVLVFGIYRIILVNFKFKCLINELDFYNWYFDNRFIKMELMRVIKSSFCEFYIVVWRYLWIEWRVIFREVVVLLMIRLCSFCLMW